MRTQVKTLGKILGIVMTGIGGGLWWQFITMPSILLGTIAGVIIACGCYLLLVYAIPTSRR